MDTHNQITINTNSQEQFLNDLTLFIKSHPHFINNDGEHQPLSEQDQIKYLIHDPDGDYEQIQIKIDLIA